MWIQSDKGFFSAVQKPGEDGLTVRARVRKHLEELKSFHPGLIGDCEITENEGTDYPYRIRCTHYQWAGVQFNEVMNIKYSNFKSHLDAVGKGGFHDLCSEVWSVLFNADKVCKADEVQKPPKPKKLTGNVSIVPQSRPCTMSHTNVQSCLEDEDCSPV